MPPSHDAAGQIFQDTQWSLVARARDHSGPALEQLCTTYRRSLLVWLKWRGGSAADAEDLVHGFFERLLKREFLANVAENKGRFRGFLLAALGNFLRDEHRTAGRARRGGGLHVESLDLSDADGVRRCDPSHAGISPDTAYDRAWAETILSIAMRRLVEESASSGHPLLFGALEPVLFAEADAPTYATIAAQLGMTEGGVKMAAHRVRRRLAELIRDGVRQTVSSEQDLILELSHLRNLFSRGTTGA